MRLNGVIELTLDEGAEASFQQFQELAGSFVVTGPFYRSLRALHPPIDARFPSVTAVGLSALQAGF